MRSFIRGSHWLAFPLLALTACGSAPTPEDEGATDSPIVTAVTHPQPKPTNCGALGEVCCSQLILSGGPPATVRTCGGGLTCTSGDICISTPPPPPTPCGYAGEICCPDGVSSSGVPINDICNDGSECQTWSGPEGICAPQENAMAPVMANPKVVIVYWGTDYYTTMPVGPFGSMLVPDPRAVICGTMISDIVSGSYMNGLAQYGITGASVVESVYIQQAPPAAGSHLTYVDMQNELLSLFKSGAVVHTPGVNEMNTFYFMMAPPGVELWLDSTTQKDDGIQGIHLHTKYNLASTRDDVIWATAKTYDQADQSAAGSVSDVVAHELVEAFNDPLGGRIELADECDGQTGGPAEPEYTLAGTSFIVPQYWSAKDLACIHGDQP